MFEEMSEKFKDADLAEVDCTVETEICGKNKVNGYPTLKLFLNGEMIDYEGGRDIGSMSIWVQSMFKPLLQWTDVEKLVADQKEKYKHTHFQLHTPSLEKLEKQLSYLKGKCILGAIKAQTEELIANRSGHIIKFTGSLTDSEAVKKFIHENSLPLFTYITTSNFGDLIRGGPVIFLYGKQENIQEQITQLEEFAKTKIHDFNLGFMTYSDPAVTFVKQFGVDPEEPQLLLINFVNDEMNKYHYSQYSPNANIEQQVAEFWDEFNGKTKQKDEL